MLVIRPGGKVVETDSCAGLAPGRPPARLPAPAQAVRAARNRCSACVGMGVRLAPESVFDMARCTQCAGTPALTRLVTAVCRVLWNTYPPAFRPTGKPAFLHAVVHACLKSP